MSMIDLVPNVALTRLGNVLSASEKPVEASERGNKFMRANKRQVEPGYGKNTRGPAPPRPLEQS